MKSSEDSAPPQQLQYISLKNNNDEFFCYRKNKIHKNEERTHIHFITRLEMNYSL